MQMSVAWIMVIKFSPNDFFDLNFILCLTVFVVFER
jgi:hypothetical protein